MSIFDDLTNLRDAINAGDRGQILDSFKHLLDDVFSASHPPVAQAAPGKAAPAHPTMAGSDPSQCKSVCDEITRAVSQPQAQPKGAAAGPVGKLGDGRLLEIIKVVLPLIIQILGL